MYAPNPFAYGAYWARALWGLVHPAGCEHTLLSRKVGVRVSLNSVFICSNASRIGHDSPRTAANGALRGLCVCQGCRQLDISRDLRGSYLYLDCGPDWPRLELRDHGMGGSLAYAQGSERRK